MLVPPVAQGGTGGRQVGDTGGARGQQSSVPGAPATLWPLAPAQHNQTTSQQSQATPPLAATPAPAHNQGVSRYGLYSLFPGGVGTSYVATPATPCTTSARAYHATTHKVSESVFSAAVGVGVGGYTWGAPTPPPGSPYSPVPVTQLELLAKNLASLAPHHHGSTQSHQSHQALSLQGAVGVNVAAATAGASLHHAQHTQHTLNLAGLHHLHHGESTMTTTSATSFTSKFIDERTLSIGGLHQNAFSPQLSLVTAGTPTLTINSFSSPTNSQQQQQQQGNVVPTTGVLLQQDYTTPTQAITSTGGCPTTVNVSAIPSGSTTSVSTMLVQAGQAGNNNGGYLQQTTSCSSSSSTKKLDNFGTLQTTMTGQTVKLENKTRQPCICKSNNGKTKLIHSDAGCSRTLPIVSSWNGQQDLMTSCTSNPNNIGTGTTTTTTTGIMNASLVKREPLATVPCQVAEVSTSLHATTTAVKIEPMPPKSENGIVVSTAGTGGIPVGIAVARQRLQHQETTSSSMRNVSLSHHTSHHASYHHFQPESLGSATAMSMGGATLVHCGTNGDERPAHLAIPSGTLAPSLNAAIGSTLNSGLSNITGTGNHTAASWPPTIWQYPTAAMPAMEPVGFPQMGVGLQSGLQGGLQLVRDPTTGHLLLIHAAEQMQQAVVWPNYPSHNGPSVGPPPLLLPPPPQPPSLQLLSDIGGARLVLTENKRKQQSSMPIVKIEGDCGSSPTTIIASAESSKTLQTVTSMTGALMPDSPLLTTLHYYPHAPALVQISQAEPTHCTSQQRNTFLSKATSPVSCLTPPPEVTSLHAIEPPETTPIGVQDASNQTDCLETDEEPLPSEPYVKQEQYSSPCHQPQQQQQVLSLNPTSFDFVSSSHERPRGTQLGPLAMTNSSGTMVDQFQFEKTGNTIVNAADCTRYATTTSSITTITRCSEVNSVDRTIESVVSCRNINGEREDLVEDDDSLNVDEESTSDERISSRLGSRVIEITEENCDSFHENLEFFGRRRDPVEQIRKPCYSEELLNEERALEEKRKEESMMMQEREDAAIQHEDEPIVDAVEATQTPDINDETVEEVASSSATIDPIPIVVENKDYLCTPKEPGVEMENQRLTEEEHPQINVKSFDMPSIDCEEEVQRVVVKQEKNEETTIIHSEDRAPCRNDMEKANRQERKQSVERYHPGIENVVEKLKKNAAAALHDHQSVDDTSDKVSEAQQPRTVIERPPRRLENGFKKLILRSCENAMNTDAFASSESTEKFPKLAENNSRITSSADVVCAKIWSPTDNNNDCNSNNNNLKLTEERSNDHGLKREKFSPVCTPTAFDDEEKEVSSLSFNAKIEINEPIGKVEISTRESSQRLDLKNASIDQVNKPRVASKPRQNVDLSGLELLSNSIEQFVHLKPGHLQNGVAQVDIDSSPTRTKSNCQQQPAESNNNEVDSPLGLLCALAEQRFMEEVADVVPKRVKENLENSEEISQAGRLLMNLGKVALPENDRKRKYMGADENLSNDAKRMCDGSVEAEIPVRESPTPFIDRIGKARRFVAKSREDTLYADKTRRNINFDEKKPEVVSTNGINGTNGSFEAAEADSTDSDVEHQDHHEALVCQPRLPFPAEEATRIQTNNTQPQNGNEQDWPNMDAMELDMRVRMADIQKQYKEKQKELSKLTPKKEEKRSPGRPRKKSHSSSDYGSLDLDAAAPKSPMDEATEDNQQALALPNLAMPRCNVNLVKLGEPRSHIKLLDCIPSIPITVPTVASPITVLPTSKLMPDDEDKSVTGLDYETSSPAPTVASSSSASKKRKVGRPRKLMCTSGSARHLTETIVAKKPKSKSSLVGYLMTSKNRHLQNKFVGKSGYTPLPFKSSLSGSKSSKAHKIAKSKLKPVKQTPLHNKNVISSIIAEKAKLSQEARLEKQVTKVKPKLKAEAKIKDWEDEESGEWSYTVENIVPEVPATPEEEPVVVTSPEPPKELAQGTDQELEPERHDKIKKKKRKSTSASPTRRKSSEHERKESRKRKSSSDCKECKECAKAARADKADGNNVNKCKLTSAHLAIDQLRVLTAMGGLFYAGRLSAVQAPDVYAITLDGERGNRPHIHSREEILRDAIVEVCPTSTKELPPGTRLCAYWSQQYRCLYPGTSVEPSEPDPELDEKFVSVEFDDGDSGRIALDDIRLLQPDYPVVEYDPNPLLTLVKRRRQTSTSTDEKRSLSAGYSVEVYSSTTAVNSNNPTSATNNQNIIGSAESDVKSTDCQKSDDTDARMLEEYRERKRLKKRRRDKLKRLHEAQEGKKKHRRHKCCEEHRKHKHRKHRKHKHRHSHHSSYSEGSHVSGTESCSGQKSEEDAASNASPQRLDDPVPEATNTESPDVQEEEEERLDEPVVDPIVPEDKSEKPKKTEKKAKARERQESVESRSKMAAFLPARQLWGWAGKGYRRPGAKGRAKKQFFRAIQRGTETIQIGDSAVFLSTGRPDRPYIGRIESMWETSSSNMIVKVKWFYHPEETVGCPGNLQYPGALFESPHMDENDVQTISHKCEVLPLPEYTEKLGKEPHRYLTIYDNNDIYYLAGYYDPTTYLLTMQPGVV